MKKKKQQRDSKLVDHFIRFIEEPGQSYAKVAAALGYRDSAVVRQWCYRRSIPTYQQDRVKKIIEGVLK